MPQTAAKTDSFPPPLDFVPPSISNILYVFSGRDVHPDYVLLLKNDQGEWELPGSCIGAPTSTCGMPLKHDAIHGLRDKTGIQISYADMQERVYLEIISKKHTSTQVPTESGMVLARWRSSTYIVLTYSYTVNEVPGEEYTIDHCMRPWKCREAIMSEDICQDSRRIIAAYLNKLWWRKKMNYHPQGGSLVELDLNLRVTFRDALSTTSVLI